MSPASPGSDVVDVDVADRVATVTLQRPDRRNAINTELVNSLLDHLAELAARPDVRVVVLTGAGRDFCVGGDVASLAGNPPFVGAAAPMPPSNRPLREVMGVVELLHGMTKPTIASINGACAGAGLSFAAATDLRYASSSAVFATAFLRVGVPGDHGGIWSVTRAVGPGRARELFLLGERFSSDDALRFGLVHEVVAPADLTAHVRQVALRLAAAAPTALAAMKANLNDALTLPLAAYLDHETERFASVSGGDEAREAARAFLEKRPPVFGAG
jgi:2-(1,2-epoxy-1,2-dihydrophenyl)acetyl-CoA isomerase